MLVHVIADDAWEAIGRPAIGLLLDVTATSA
jgi:hypothetical protein